MALTNASAGLISVRVNGAEYDLAEVSLSWLRQQVDRRHRAGEQVCVVIAADSDSVRITLATPGCASGPAGHRPPTPAESDVFARWRQLVVDKGDFSAGNLWAFLQYLDRVV